MAPFFVQISRLSRRLRQSCRKKYDEVEDFAKRWTSPSGSLAKIL